MNNKDSKLLKEGILNKKDVVNAYDKYLEKINEDPNNMNLNNYMSDLLFELEDEEDLDVANEAEAEIRSKYNIRDDESEDDYYALEESKGPREETNKFLTYVTDVEGIDENSNAYKIIMDLCNYLSEDEVEDFVKQYGYSEDEEEEIYTADADEIRTTIQEELSNEQRIKLYNMYNVEEIEEWNEDTEKEFWDWVDILDSDELEELAEDINKLTSSKDESKEIKTEGNYKADYFSGIDFEKKLPREMRFKEYSFVNNDKDLFWVTQEYFTKRDLEKFAEALKETPFEKAYVTVRDLSSYNIDKDLKQNVVAIIYGDDTIDSKGYEEATNEYLDFDTGNWKN